MKQSENDSATQRCWRSYREPTHVAGPRPHRGRVVPRPDREKFLSDSGPRCCKLSDSDARVPTANQRSRSGAVPWRWRYQTDGHIVVNYHKVAEEERTEKESQPEEPVMEKKTGRGNVRLSSTARWRRTTVTWTTLPRGSNSGKQKTSADDTRWEKRTTSDTTGTKSWHCNLEDEQQSRCVTTGNRRG